ncbi:MAG: hypothetical protein WBC51_03710, partial [Vicinamibacterales bacterium]
IGRLRVTGPPVALRVLRYGTAVGLLVQATAQRIIAREPTHARGTSSSRERTMKTWHSWFF